MKLRLLALSLVLAPLAGCQSTAETTTLVTPANGAIRSAGPGDTVMSFRSTRPMPNIFGQPSIYGRRTPSGHTTVRYLGSQGGKAVFERSDVAIESNDSTLNHTPLFIPRTSTTSVNGMIGTTPISGSATSSGFTVIGPRATTSYATQSAPIQFALGAGESTTIEGQTLTVRRVSAGSVEYQVK